ncbi:Serine/threonine-protein kinase tel1 [Lecanicillium sp. MT-2017a]|nr:Serine/threonine-protein kinase tel1 [Lecanicillium sp. MT-2017a]
MVSKTVNSLISELKSTNAKDRDKAVDDLLQLLSPHSRALNLSELGDKSYHDIFEAVFSHVLREKSAYYGNGRSKSQSTSTAATRLTRSASAVRAAASRGALKIKQKTLFAVIDHITQVLPGPNEGFVPPLLNDYVKALTELLSRPSHVEFLSRLDGARWQKQCFFGQIHARLSKIWAVKNSPENVDVLNNL